MAGRGLRQCQRRASLRRCAKNSKLETPGPRRSIDRGERSWERRHLAGVHPRSSTTPGTTTDPPAFYELPFFELFTPFCGHAISSCRAQVPPPRNQGCQREKAAATNEFLLSATHAANRVWCHILPGQRDRRQKLAENFGCRLGVSEERCPRRPLPERTTPPTVKRTAKCVVYPTVRVVNNWAFVASKLACGKARRRKHPSSGLRLRSNTAIGRV